MFKIPWEWPRKKLEPPPQTKATSADHPTPTPSSIRPIYKPINSSRRQDSEYGISSRFDSCRPNVMLPDASCSQDMPPVHKVHKTCLLFTKSTRHASCSQSPQDMPPVHKVHKTCLPFTKFTRHASRSQSPQGMPAVHTVHKACLPFTQSTRHASCSQSPQDMPPVHKIYKACLLFTKSTRHASCSQNPQDMPPVHKARN